MKWKHDSCFMFFSFTFENAYFYVDNVYFPVEDMMTTFDFQELKKWPIFIMIQSILVLHYRYRPYSKYYKDLYRNRTVFPNKGNIYCRHLWASHRRNSFFWGLGVRKIALWKTCISAMTDFVLSESVKWLPFFIYTFSLYSI